MSQADTQLALPFMLVHPEKCMLHWICDYDEDRRITSVFVWTANRDKPERKVAFLENEQQAQEWKDILLQHGWKYSRPMDIEIRDAEGRLVASKTWKQ